MRCTE